MEKKYKQKEGREEKKWSKDRNKWIKGLNMGLKKPINENYILFLLES